jgi:hypothetical protein
MELLLLDEHSPKKCKNCGKYLKTRLAGSVVSVVVPVMMAAAALIIFSLDFFISMSLLLLIPILRTALATPMKYSLSSTGVVCLQCRQTNIGFSFADSKLCDNCALRIKK